MCPSSKFPRVIPPGCHKATSIQAIGKRGKCKPRQILCHAHVRRGTRQLPPLSLQFPGKFTQVHVKARQRWRNICFLALHGNSPPASWSQEIWLPILPNKCGRYCGVVIPSLSWGVLLRIRVRTDASSSGPSHLQHTSRRKNTRTSRSGISRSIGSHGPCCTFPRASLCPLTTGVNLLHDGEYPSHTE